MALPNCCAARDCNSAEKADCCPKECWTEITTSLHRYAIRATAQKEQEDWKLVALCPQPPQDESQSRETHQLPRLCGHPSPTVRPLCCAVGSINGAVWAGDSCQLNPMITKSEAMTGHLLHFQGEKIEEKGRGRRGSVRGGVDRDEEDMTV